MAAGGFQRGKMAQKEEESILTHIDEIRRGVNPKHVIDHLKNNSIISLEDVESIENLPTRFDRVDELVSVIRHRGPHAFRGFINALNAAAYSDLARKLKETAEKKEKTGAKLKKPTTLSLSTRTSQSEPNSPSVASPLRRNSAGIRPITPQVQRRESITDRRPTSAQKKVAVVRAIPSSRGEQRRPPSARVTPKKKSVDESFLEETIPKTPVESKEHSFTGATSRQPSAPVQTVRAESINIQQSLNSAHEQVTSHVDVMLPMLDSISSDDESIDKEEMKKRLAEHMTRVAEEKRTVERSAGQGDERFNRDMIIMVFQMNQMLSFMMDVLQKLVVSLKGKGTDYDAKIEGMNKHIQQLQADLEEKNEELTELKRDHQVETHMLSNELKSAVQALKKVSLNLKIEKEKEEKLPIASNEGSDDNDDSDSGDSSDDSNGFVPCYSTETVFLRADRTGTDNNRRGPGQKSQKPKSKEMHKDRKK